jgi:hypothetical protein
MEGLMPDPTPDSAPRDSRFEDVLAEILQAEEQGQTPDFQRYYASFPEL